MRLIDADELEKCAIPCEIHNGALTELCIPLYQIDNAQTIEAYPFEQVQELVKLNQQFAQEIKNLKRPKGEWVYNDYGNGCGNWHCSECGTIIFMCKNSNNNFCPNCGAEMRGEK